MSRNLFEGGDDPPEGMVPIEKTPTGTAMEIIDEVYDDRVDAMKESLAALNRRHQHPILQQQDEDQ